MLNQNLAISELQKSLEKYIDVIDLIQEDILGEQKRSLANDKKRLGLIHHALNIENYAKSGFRQRLLEHAEDRELFNSTISFILQCEISMMNLSPDVNPARATFCPL